MAAYVTKDAVPPDGVLPIAEAKATALFRQIGVTLRWRSGAAPATAPVDACGAPLIIRLESSEQAHASPEALAFATPFADSGACIHVLLDRVLRYSKGTFASVVLAYVLAHEITHILERTNWHSQEGIMKAHWDRTDYERMLHPGLAFSHEDADLIHSGIAGRVARAE